MMFSLSATTYAIGVGPTFGILSAVTSSTLPLVR